ncbi:hypothetical protein OsJ_06752 [Oryza sativa Japonica Group]|uniref:FAR1 domain-containing protein n=1 Tax=Oryza sativa subsp. japonica TaxID=39947 RepID=B9F011_ORYSJ|nr:hypothetical protein OsJ_06752 [Oryza sativa Japonica Group]
MDERGVGDEPVLMGEVQQVGESNPTLSEASQRTGFTFNSVGHHAMGESSNCNLEGHNVVFRSDREKSEQVTQSNIKATNQNAPCEQVPKVGMTFQSEDDAYNFYNSYARRVGFSVRKCHVNYRADGTLSSKYMVCSNEGEETTQPSNINIAGASQPTVQEPLDSNIVMPFGDISRMFVPPIRGEFTNLLFQAHHETTAAASASWRLEFENQDPNSSTSYD